MLRYLEKGPAPAAQAPYPGPRAAPAPESKPPQPPVSARAPPTSAPAPAPAKPTPVQRVVPLGEDKVVPIKGLQRTMVKTMVAASAVPVFGYADEIDVTELVATRARLKRAAEERGIKLSYLPFIMKAVSLALREFPMLNAHVNADCTEVVWKVFAPLTFPLSCSGCLPGASLPTVIVISRASHPFLELSQSVSSLACLIFIHHVFSASHYYCMFIVRIRWHIDSLTHLADVVAGRAQHLARDADAKWPSCAVGQELRGTIRP